MPTVQEILKQTGLTDEQIAGLDARTIGAFGTVLTTAERERERAEVERRANAEWYDQTVAPALNGWASDKANMEAQLAYYKAQNEGARSAGFIAENLPERDGQGRFVAGAPGGTPGSPTFQGIDELRRDVGGALGTLADLQWRHQRLFNAPMPISPTQLVREAESQRLDPAAYAEKRFGFQAREQEIARKAEEEKISAATKAAVEANDRKWAEKIGSNPDVRIGQPSRFADVARAVRANERPDPLTLNEAQRKAATRQAIHSEIAERDMA